MDEEDSPTLIDELEKSTLSVADESSVELDSSAKLEELSTARTSPELPKSPKASESATFSDSEQATNANTAKRHKKFFTNPPPKSRNQHSSKIHSNYLKDLQKISIHKISVEICAFLQNSEFTPKKAISPHCAFSSSTLTSGIPNLTCEAGKFT